MRSFLFWKWHADAPEEASCGGYGKFVCCDGRMKLYKVVVKSGPPKQPVARCMKCGRQFMYQYNPSGCVDGHDVLRITNYPIEA
jgi:hypothetical protein